MFVFMETARLSKKGFRYVLFRMKLNCNEMMLRNCIHVLRRLLNCIHPDSEGLEN